VSDGLARLPGVERVAWARRVMLAGSGGGATVEVDVPGQDKRRMPFNQVSPSYFATTGARILSGRPFGEADSASATPVVLVNSLFARRFLAGRDPLGSWVHIGTTDRQIVGVVEDGPYNHLREDPQPFVYFPFAQRPSGEVTWMLETSGDPGRLSASVRSYLRRADPSYTQWAMQTFAEHMRASRADQQVAATVSGTVAAVGLALAAAGLFGVTMFAVARRTREFGVRVAMGASPAQVMRQVLRDAGRQIAMALPLGCLLTWAGRRVLEKLLYGVAPDDPRILALASAVVAAVAFLAALQPALRAARIDPLTALRHE
jgi:hypothetical protein